MIVGVGSTGTIENDLCLLDLEMNINSKVSQTGAHYILYNYIYNIYCYNCKFIKFSSRGLR